MSERPVQIIPADTPVLIQQVRELVVEYGQWLGEDLNFQGFTEELAGLPGDYAPPRGRLYVARVKERTAGCIALRPLQGDICEMKRLYVRPDFRNLGIGRLLAMRIIDDARAIGYTYMRLDTIPKLAAANKLYEKIGFVDIQPYYFNPIANVRYMELCLNSQSEI